MDRAEFKGTISASGQLGAKVGGSHFILNLFSLFPLEGTLVMICLEGRGV